MHEELVIQPAPSDLLRGRECEPQIVLAHLQACLNGDEVSRHRDDLEAGVDQADDTSVDRQEHQFVIQLPVHKNREPISGEATLVSNREPDRQPRAVRATVDQ